MAKEKEAPKREREVCAPRTGGHEVQGEAPVKAPDKEN